MVGIKGHKSKDNYSSRALQGDNRKKWTGTVKELEDMKLQDLKNIMCEYTGKCQAGYGVSRYNKSQMIDCILKGCPIKPSTCIPKTVQQVDNLSCAHVEAACKMLDIDGRARMNTEERKDAIKRAIRKEQQRR